MTEREQNEIKKEYLNSYKNLCNKLKSLEEQLQSLRASTESAKIQTISDMPRGNKQSDLSDYMVKVDQLEKDIAHKRNECLSKKLAIEKCVANMENGIESDIIRKRYIELMAWEKICVEIKYSWMQTHRLHSKALSNVVID